MYEESAEANIISDGKCPILIFFDNHDDPANEIIISGLMEDFKESGFNTFCMQIDHTVEQSSYLSHLNDELKEVIGYIKNNKEHVIFKLILPSIEILKTLEKNKITFASIDASEIELNIYDLLGKINSGYSSQYLQHLSMALHIDAACQKNGGKLIVHSGLAHGELQSLLVQKGYTDIKSVWAFSDEVKNPLELDLLANNAAAWKQFPLGLSIIDLRYNYSALQTLETQLGLEPGKFTQFEYEAIYNRLFA